MTQLSPAAQAVHDAFWSHPNGKPLVQDCPDTDQLVAALRAVTKELKYFGITEKNILAIAAELKDGN